MFINYLNIYGYKIKIVSKKFNTDTLISDFQYFNSTKIANYDCLVKINFNSKNSFKKKGLYLRTTNMCEVRQISFTERQMIYSINSSFVSEVRYKNFAKIKYISINTSDFETTKDILYFIFLSISGEYLDSNKMMRLHAVSFSYNEKSFVFIGRQKVGKSTIAEYFINEPGYQFFSDEITILNLNDMKIYPFPVPIKTVNTNINCNKSRFFNEKNKIFFPNAKISPPKVLNFVFLLKRKTALTIKIASFFEKFISFFEIVLGIGVIQMAEYLIRLNNISTILVILKNRFLLFFTLNKKCFFILTCSNNKNHSLNFIKLTVENIKN